MNVDDQDVPRAEELNQKAQSLEKQRNTLVTDVSILVDREAFAFADAVSNTGRNQGQSPGIATA